jgi:hypothetical protein
LTVINSDNGLREYFEYLKNHIQTVHAVIKGRSESLLAFRETWQEGIQSYILVILSIDVLLLDRHLLAMLSLLLGTGPSAGVSFLIISTTTGAPVSMLRQCSKLSVDRGSVSIDDDNGRSAPFEVYTAEEIISVCGRFASAADDARLSTDAESGTILFEGIHDRIHDLSAQWQENSRDGLTFFIGKSGPDQLGITIGDRKNQRHNALITGAVGQGKSNLISVIIHSLSLRYSPREINLYLLDFKEGVSLQSLANIGQETYLPHVRVLGLESDVDFGLAVLEHLYAEYRFRMRLFKDSHTKDISEYRELNPKAEFPRIVVIIDEFQLMFGDDDIKSKRIADLLEKSVRLYRAAGIHFILASQSIGGNFALLGKSEIIFSQIPIRIAHKNSVLESELTLAGGNTEAAYLRPREAIVNSDYGIASQNREVRIAYADEKLFSNLRRRWWEQAKSYAGPPNIFDGQMRVTAADAFDAIVSLAASATPLAVFGKELSITDSYLAIPLLNESGKNIAFLGTSTDRDNDYALGIIQATALSLALHHRGDGARLLFCSFMDEDAYRENRMPQFLQLLERMGISLETIAADAFCARVIELDEGEVSYPKPLYLFALGLDRWQVEADKRSPPLAHLLHTGPGRGIHFIGWWLKSSNYEQQAAGASGTDDVNSKVLLRIDVRSAQGLSPQVSRWAPQDNRVLVIDEVELDAPRPVIPFVPLTDGEIELIAGKI